MKTRRSVVLLISIVCLASCAMSHRSRRPDSGTSVEGNTRLVAHPREVVWSAIQAYMAERKWPLAESNQNSGTIRSGSFHLDDSRDYAHCRSGRRSSVTGYEASLNIEMRRMTANGTTVTIDTRIAAISEAGKEPDCSSTGALERELVAGIDSLVAAWR